MRVLLFQPRFAPLVKSGQKTQTIRAKARCKPGDTLSLREWTGRPRWSKQRVLREAACVWVRPLVITPEGGYASLLTGEKIFIRRENFAKQDGFESWAEMRDWFEATHGLPFSGEVIGWEVEA